MPWFLARKISETLGLVALRVPVFHHPCERHAVDEERTLNMSECGCLVESSLPVKVRDNLQLRLSFQESEPSMHVSRAAVCWVRGFRFGIEFIGIGKKDRIRLNRYVTLLGGDPWARTYD